MKVIGIMLVRDEDLFVERALRNAIGFCDAMIVCDHCSKDGTPAILGRLRDEFRPKIDLRRVASPRESHDAIRAFAGTAAWVFGVDGDEVYDPSGLDRFRLRLEAGEFERAWVVFGNVLNVRSLDFDAGRAAGHLAPPCRSMTKLYNFAAIDDWGGNCPERLHGGTIRFRDGYHAGLRTDYHARHRWEDSDFRCLHLCFLRRSSAEREGGAARKNIMDRHAWSAAKLAASLRAVITGARALNWKEQKYARGPLVEKPLDPFFPR